jgi:hypothetical protein
VGLQGVVQAVVVNMDQHHMTAMQDPTAAGGETPEVLMIWLVAISLDELTCQRLDLIA